MHRRALVLVLAAVVGAAVVACDDGTVILTQAGHGGLPNITPRPAEDLLAVEDVGPISRSLPLIDGEYAFRWLVTAGEADCAIAIVLDGPVGSLVVDDYGRVDAGHAAFSMTKSVDLPAGTYTVRLDTDCPGESQLWMWRYL